MDGNMRDLIANITAQLSVLETTCARLRNEKDLYEASVKEKTAEIKSLKNHIEQLDCEEGLAGIRIHQANKIHDEYYELCKMIEQEAINLERDTDEVCRDALKTVEESYNSCEPESAINRFSDHVWMFRRVGEHYALKLKSYTQEHRISHR